MQAAIPDNAQLLAELRDIHAAAEPGWWPPAPGWWVMAALALLVLFVLLRTLVRRVVAWRRRQAWLQALAAVDGKWDPAADPHAYLADLNRLFRAVAIRAFPDSGCGRLQGEEWVSFIQALLPEGPATQCLGALAHGPYEPLPEFDAAALVEQARTWVQRYG
jgi:hypothetical protein